MSFFKSYFDFNQIIILVTAGVLLTTSVLLHQNKKYRLSILVLLASSFAIFLFGALLDPFLNIWDERFHALAAKNMMNHPLMPTLYDDPVVDMAYDRWDRYHVWIHKQPLFLWLIALSFKLFGVSELSLRLPDVMLSTFMVFAIYRMGAIMVNDRVGYLAAIFATTNFYLIQLVAGRQMLDHNDLIFTVFITLSIWSFLEYHLTGYKIWLILIGLFSGFAILTKWLVGLLVYLGWAALRFFEGNFKIRKNLDLSIALIITVVVALPWQILTYLWYPAEAASSNKFNVLHFKTPLDGHAGDFWFHLNQIDDFYGVIAPFIVVPAFYFLYKSMKNAKLFWASLVMVGAVFLFFSMAQTKMPSFTFVTASIFAVAFAAFFDMLFSKIESLPMNKIYFKLIMATFVAAIVLSSFDVEKLQEQHTLWKPENYYSRAQVHNKQVFESLALPSNTVIFNVKGRHYIEAMFYTGVPACNFVPSMSDLQKMKEENRRVAIFRTPETDTISFLKMDNSILWIDKTLMQCD